ncbi:DHA2 family efflux MFS transporter permease subunit [uncultured Schumannella sp.]|uniref:DHA2 family efflux MFS transporter permease subunit n=1 Tax=uncultured Schumannella sp. TaxID=1195956 RepID=UPI0025E3FB98|nr:DHA2 family efflux MFS transporter permease subunit [uncultured Schumannella sp.]
MSHHSAAAAALQRVEPLSAQTRLALVLLLAATFVVFLNETTMSVAIPEIMDDLAVTPALGQWLTTAFALTMAVVIPITGWLLQRLNTRPVFIVAMALFSAGTLLAALAPTFGLLVAARVVQATGTAVMMPLMMTTVLSLVPMHSRGRIMGRVSIVMSMAPAVGPMVAGLILAVTAWRGIFWVMLPIALVMLAIGIARVPNVSEPRRVPLDVMSVILSAFAFSAIVYGLSSFGEAAEGEVLVAPWIPLTIGLVFLVAFIARQLVLQRTDGALLDLRTFRSRTFTISVSMLSIAMVALFGMVIVLPIYTARALGLEAVQTGLILLPGGLLMGLMGPLVGRLYDRLGPRPLVIPGAVIVSVVFWGLTLISTETPVGMLIAAHVALSVGLALLFTPLFTSGLGALPPHLYSHGSATVMTIQQVAGAAGAALFIAFLTIGTIATGAADPNLATPEQLAVGVRLAFLTGAIVSVVLIPAAFLVQRPAKPELSDEELEAAAPVGH